MKTSANTHSMNDDELHCVLRQAPARVQLPNSFNREVWSRIEAEESLSFHTCITRMCQSFFTLLARPGAALAVIAASMLLGLCLGISTSSEPFSEGEWSYVRSIHPLLQSHQGDPP